MKFYYFINLQPDKFSGATHGMHLSMRAEKKIPLGARNIQREAFKNQSSFLPETHSFIISAYLRAFSKASEK